MLWAGRLAAGERERTMTRLGLRRCATMGGIILLISLGTLQAADKGVIPGLELLLTEQKALIEGKRVGLITNHSGVDRNMRHAIDLLSHAPGVKLTALFAPEHGIRGIAEAGDKVVDSIDERSGVPIYSIYGPVRRPTPEMLKNVDVLIYDIQDVGVRFYTFISTMGECMAAAGEKGIPFLVLDRPNVLADTAVEGRMLDISRFKTFVGAYEVPIRYGWTLGELAGFVKETIKKESGKELQLVVVKLKNWKRDMWYDQTGLSWIPPSPNIPTLASAIVYPGMCLIEGTNVSEGRGTTLPFETCGAPWIDGYKLADQLNSLKLPGVLFRPTSFNPTFSKFQGQACQGIQLHVMDRNRFQAVRTALHVLSILRKEYPAQFQWRESHMDRLSGSDDVRKAIDQGISVDRIMTSWEEGLKAFNTLRQRYLLYP
jgi:uncharacterized protein YbbC (DUF1343 family)